MPGPGAVHRVEIESLSSLFLWVSEICRNYNWLCHRYFLLQFLGSVMHTVRIKVVLAVNLTTVGVIIYDYRITHVQKCGDYNVMDI